MKHIRVIEKAKVYLGFGNHIVFLPGKVLEVGGKEVTEDKVKPGIASWLLLRKLAEVLD